MISNVKGQFTVITGPMMLDPNDIANSQIEASVDAASINARDPQRDTHLKSPDFFDVEKFTTLTFASTRVERKSEGELAVTGNLTIHGVTREVVSDVEGPTPPHKDPWGNTRIGVSATSTINREDFGLNLNAALEAGGILVGDEVTITSEVELVKIRRRDLPDERKSLTRESAGQNFLLTEFNCKSKILIDQGNAWAFARESSLDRGTPGILPG
jgi:polyisoprenoid-binding protein YceI